MTQFSCFSFVALANFLKKLSILRESSEILQFGGEGCLVLSRTKLRQFQTRLRRKPSPDMSRIHQQVATHSHLVAPHTQTYRKKITKKPCIRPLIIFVSSDIV